MQIDLDMGTAAEFVEALGAAIGAMEAIAEETGGVTATMMGRYTESLKSLQHILGDHPKQLSKKEKVAKWKNK